MHDYQRRPLDAVEGDREGHETASTHQPRTGAQARELAASNSREGGFLGQRINVLLGRGLPDTQALVDLLRNSTPEEREAVAADRGLVDRLVDACPIEALPAVLNLLVSDPKWALHHYLCRRGGRDPEAARGLLAGATTAQQLEIVRWAELVGRLSELFGGHPDGLFGAALGQRVDAELARGAGQAGYARFQSWRSQAAGQDPIRIGRTLERLAHDAGALAAARQGQPSALSRVLGACPRGAALDPTARGHLDRIALVLRGLGAEQLREAFAVRFGVELPSAALDVHGIRSVWARLAPLDPARITAQLVHRASVDPHGGVAGWQVADFVDDTTREPPAPPPEGERAEPEAEAPASGQPDRVEADRAALLDAFLEACGGDGALRVAAEAFLDDQIDGAGWQAAVEAAEGRGALAAPADEVMAALRRLRDGGQARIAVSGPARAPSARREAARHETAREGSKALPAWVAGLGPKPDPG